VLKKKDFFVLSLLIIISLNNYVPTYLLRNYEENKEKKETPYDNEFKSVTLSSVSYISVIVPFIFLTGK